jgi:tol-pal system protein YbgF
VLALALAGSGCATRASVTEVQREVSTVRAALTEVRVAQDLITADLARIVAELRSLEARGAESQATQRESSAELARLRARLQDAENEVQQIRAPRAATPPVVAAGPPTTAAPAAPAAPPAALPAPSELERAGDVADEPAETAFAAALNTFRAREHGQAVLDFSDFIAKYPTHALAPQAQYWIGEAYYVQRDYRHALVELQRVLEMTPRAPAMADALVRIGLCHAQLREPARAAAAWQRVVRDFPRSAAAGRARALLRPGAAARQP